MQANAEPGPPKPPFDRERFVFHILAVVIGTQYKATLIPPSSCCWRCWVEQRCRGWTGNPKAMPKAKPRACRT